MMQKMDRRQALKKYGLLTGISMSATGVAVLLKSCQSENALDWEPLFFTSSQAKTVSAMVDLILPKTDTPSATDLNVHIFVDRMFAKSLSPGDQVHARKGLEDFESECDAAHGRPFSSLSVEQQQSLLADLGKKTNQFNPSIWGSTLGVQPPIDFYRRLRQFALFGYFTSEEIGKHVLAYDPIPGAYEGCTDLKEGQKIWSL